MRPHYCEDAVFTKMCEIQMHASSWYRVVSHGEPKQLETPDVHTADFSYMRMRKEEYSDKARSYSNRRF